jgi:hypothetical protein
MKRDISMDKLLVRQVSALVDEVANATSDNNVDHFRNQAHLYRFLAANCEEKAKMSDAFAAKAAEKRSHNERQKNHE